MSCNSANHTPPLSHHHKSNGRNEDLPLDCGDFYKAMVMALDTESRGGGYCKYLLLRLARTTLLGSTSRASRRGAWGVGRTAPRNTKRADKEGDVEWGR